MRSVLQAWILGLAVAPVASAGFGDFTIIQTAPFVGELSPFAQKLTFDQTVLTPRAWFWGITIGFEGTISAKATAENDGDRPAPQLGIQLTGFIDVEAPGGLGAAASVSAAAESGGVGPSDGVPGSGPDFFDFGLIADSATDEDLIIDGAHNFAPYIGVGTVDVLVSAQGGFAVTGGANATIDLSDFMVEGTVTLTYFYHPPAPGTAALGAIALVGLRRRCRV